MSYNCQLFVFDKEYLMSYNCQLFVFDKEYLMSYNCQLFVFDKEYLMSYNCQLFLSRIITWSYNSLLNVISCLKLNTNDH